MDFVSEANLNKLVNTNMQMGGVKLKRITKTRK